MVKTLAKPSRHVRTFSFTERLKEIDLFFEKRGREHKTMRDLIKRLDKAGIAYAVMGGMAVNAHKYERTTKDVDILVKPEGLADFRRRFVPKYYQQVEGRSRRFMDLKHQVTIDLLVAGQYPGFGKPGPITFPDPDQVSELFEGKRVIDLRTLIELKLAAQRWRDFADVVELIRFNELDESFMRKLHRSVHADYRECLEEKRREDEYESRP